MLEVRALPVALPPSPHVAQMLDVLLPLSISPATLDAVCYRMQAAFPTAEQFWEPVYCLRPRLPLGSRLSAFFPLGTSSCQTSWSWLECSMAAPWMPPPLRLGWVSNKRFFMRKSMLVGQGRRVACFCSVLVSPGRQATLGFYSTFFLVSKKDRGVHSLLGLWPSMGYCTNRGSALWSFPCPMLLSHVVFAVVVWLRLSGIRLHAVSELGCNTASTGGCWYLLPGGYHGRRARPDSGCVSFNFCFVNSGPRGLSHKS